MNEFIYIFWITIPTTTTTIVGQQQPPLPVSFQPTTKFYLLFGQGTDRKIRACSIYYDMVVVVVPSQLYWMMDTDRDDRKMGKQNSYDEIFQFDSGPITLAAAATAVMPTIFTTTTTTIP